MYKSRLQRRMHTTLFVHVSDAPKKITTHHVRVYTKDAAHVWRNLTAGCASCASCSQPSGHELTAPTLKSTCGYSNRLPPPGTDRLLKKQHACVTSLLHLPKFVVKVFPPRSLPSHCSFCVSHPSPLRITLVTWLCFSASATVVGGCLCSGFLLAIWDMKATQKT